MNVTPAYIPILRVKTGELEALSQLKGKTPQEIIPFFEIPKITVDIQKKVAFRNSNQITIDYLNDLTMKIKQLKWNRLFFDFFDWKMNSYTENGEHVINYMFRKLISDNIKVNPVIGFDRWDSIDYKKAILSIDLPSDCSYCIRIDSESINDSYDREFFRERLNKIFLELGISSRECILQIDFSDLTKRSIEDVYKDMNRLIDIVSEWDFSYLILSGGSFPAIINDAVKNTDSTDEVLRKEMIVWKMIQNDRIKEKVVFSDYGIRNPLAAEGIIATHANGKIRYTINDKYFVARGHSKQKGNKGKQQYELARVILNSGYYLGSEFSWGDERIKDCSEEKVKGNPTQWISFDTNHHITYVVAEIKEFQRSHVISRERSKSKV